MKHIITITLLIFSISTNGLRANKDVEDLRKEHRSKKIEIRSLEIDIVLLELDEKIKDLKKERDKHRLNNMPLAKIKVDPATHFFEAWLYCQSAEEGDPAESEANLNKAIQMLRDIKRTDPDWKPHIVEKRLKWALDTKNKE
ncbi:hypothetical protein [Rubritalea sp.]|uniref:hypothetical protein n=1 Tax=Rubritalea sp. TaxID=2109375 RepID=UPI003EFAE1C4